MVNCLNQFLLTMVLSIEERVFLAECVFREGNRYTDLVHSDFPNAMYLRTVMAYLCLKIHQCDWRF